MESIGLAYLIEFSKKYGYDQGQITGHWKTFCSNLFPHQETASKKSISQGLSKMTVAQLRDVCKQKGLITTGSRNDLLKRIREPPVAHEDMRFYLDKSGYYVNSETNLIVDKTTNLIIGRLDVTGVKVKLDEDDINKCKEINMKWDETEIATTQGISLNSISSDHEESDIESDGCM